MASTTTTTHVSRGKIPSISKRQEVAKYIIDNGNDIMKDFAERYGNSKSRNTPESIFFAFFPYPNKIQRDRYQYTKEELLCVATIYLFFNQKELIKKFVTLLQLYDAIKGFFEDQNDGIKELLRNPDNSVLLSDLSMYWRFWKIFAPISLKETPVEIK